MESSIGRRIIIIGNSNSGKSTLAERLSKHLDATFIELDALHWEPNWTEAQPDVFRERVSQAISAESWVMAGNYSKQVDLSWPLADTIVWLDLPLHLVLRRCISRTWRRYREKQELWNGNRERFWDHLMLWDTDKSLVSFTVRYHRARRRRNLAIMQDPQWAHINFVHLRSVADIEAWVDRAIPPTS